MKEGHKEGGMKGESAISTHVVTGYCERVISIENSCDELSAINARGDPNGEPSS